ncbi:MAG: hypothetical protein DVS81_13540 [Candidatus Accumulibacter meliphilus]|uniref:Uncharacterized protein n=1 Tax=Candidatus Accumulibacter meliphilus TaxID=2211374 RepID=A0A369XNH1_9PROT|nr:MAG: hypothetical protein DVS81_13540 [Candidatus Accumulibacter meliphilus]
MRTLAGAQIERAVAGCEAQAAVMNRGHGGGRLGIETVAARLGKAEAAIATAELEFGGRFR